MEKIKFYFYLIFAVPFLVFSKNSLSNMSSSYKNIPMVYNQRVKRWMSVFVHSKPSYVKIWLARSYRYLPEMKSTLKDKGLPTELAYITLIESSLSANAVSSAQAVGYWQFIDSTARRYGLRVNRWLDERKDYQKSTVAATTYLQDLYKMFDDWLLALSAYNMGENRLKKLIKKYGTKNFWILSQKHDFPRETARYVPKFLAVTLIMKSPSKYGFTHFPILSPYEYEVFYAPGGIKLASFLKDSGLSLKKFKELNPSLKKLTLPHLMDNHLIRLPKGKGISLSLWLRQKKS